MLKFFPEKNVSSFYSAKATHIFSAKNTRILYIESTKTFNETTLNILLQLIWIYTACADPYTPILRVITLFKLLHLCTMLLYLVSYLENETQ